MKRVTAIGFGVCVAIMLAATLAMRRSTRSQSGTWLTSRSRGAARRSRPSSTSGGRAHRYRDAAADSGFEILSAVTVHEANDDGDTGTQDERDLIRSHRRLAAEQGDRQGEHPDQHRDGDQGLSDAGIARMETGVLSLMRPSGTIKLTKIQLTDPKILFSSPV